MKNLVQALPLQKILKNIEQYDKEGVLKLNTIWDRKDMKSLKIVIILDIQPIPYKYNKIINESLLLFTCFDDKFKRLWRSFIIMTISTFPQRDGLRPFKCSLDSK